jgi:hypothetical protein
MNRPIQTFDSRSPIAFDGNIAVVFIVYMLGSVQQTARVRNIAPGVLYTFIFIQDAEGGFTFDWPPQCTNGTAIDPAPNSTTVQNFIGYTGGLLKANIPGTGGAP